MINYSEDDLEQFEGLFRHSKLLGLIDNTDTSITSSAVNVTMGHYLLLLLMLQLRIQLVLIMRFMLLMMAIINQVAE